MLLSVSVLMSPSVFKANLVAGFHGYHAAGCHFDWCQQLCPIFRFGVCGAEAVLAPAEVTLSSC